MAGNVNLVYGTGREEVSIGLFCFWLCRIKEGCFYTVYFLVSGILFWRIGRRNEKQILVSTLVIFFYFEDIIVINLILEGSLSKGWVCNDNKKNRIQNEFIVRGPGQAVFLIFYFLIQRTKSKKVIRYV